MNKKLLRKFIFLSIVILVLVTGLITWLSLTQNTFNQDSFMVTNLGNNGFTVYWETEEPTISKAKVRMRDFDREWNWQFDDRDNPDNLQKRKLHHVTFTELDSKEDYVVEISNTVIPVNLGQRFHKAEVKTDEPRESSAGIPDRVYGYVRDHTGERYENAVVFLSIDEENYLSSVTDDKGSYSFDISALNPPKGEFIEKIEVVTEDYPSKEYIAQSSVDRPVPDIELEEERAEDQAEPSASRFDWMGLLSSEVMASNSCFEGMELGGTRVQCDSNVHWMKEMNVNNCPSPTRFRVGLVAHTDKTFLFQPDKIKFKLVDKETGKTVAEDIKNGGYVMKSRTDLNFGENGEAFEVIAYKASGECNNFDGEAVVRFDERTEVYGTVTPSDSGSSSSSSSSSQSSGQAGTMPTVTPSEQSCQKYGENFASLVPVDASMYGKASDIGMKWGEAIAVHRDGVIAWGANVPNAYAEGMSPILRICYKGSCAIEDGGEYGNVIADVYEDLLNSGNLPSEGLYIHAGHNEPNVAEYRSPREEGEFVAAVIRTLQDRDIPISRNPDDSGIKLIGPNLDLFNQTTGTGPDGHPIYTAKDYLEEMVVHCGGVSANLYAMAVNDYYITHDGSNFRDVHSDVKNFIDYLQTKTSLPNNVFITETGKAAAQGGRLVHTDAMSWSEFGAELAKLDSIDEVKGILLFNSLGLNPDSNFQYHKQLWDDPKIIQEEILAGCSLSDIRNTQESDVSDTGSSGSGDSGNTGPIPVSSLEPTEGLYCGDFNCTFVQWQGIPEIYLPKNWHAWWDDGSGTGSNGGSYCGDFQNSGEHYNCGRPEYGPMSKDLYSNRAIDGDSLKYFSTYRTHNAGVFTSVRIAPEGSIAPKEEDRVVREVKFKAKALSWTAPGTVTYHGQVGIHPQGGVNRGEVEWGDYRSLADVDPNDDATWTDLEVSLKTTSDVVTLFIRGNNQYAMQNNDSYWENAELFVDGEKLVAENPPDSNENIQVIAEANDSQANITNSTQTLETADNLTGSTNVLGESSYSSSYPNLPDEMDEPGKYVVRSDKYHVLLPYIDKFEGEDPDMRFFYDTNMNLKKDPNEAYVMDMGQIEVERVSDAVKYDLKEGFNFVSFPMELGDIKTASDFLGKVRTNGGYASGMSSYYSGYWISYSDVNGYGYGENFDLLPGRGYIIKVETPTTLTFDGNKFSDPVPFDLMEGWNLIAVHGTDEVFSSRDLLSHIYDSTDIKSDNITSWLTEGQTYKGFHYDPDAKKYYGDDFELKDDKAYFVRVRDGEGLVEF